MRQRNRVWAALLVTGLMMSAGLAGTPAAAVEVFPQLVSVSASGVPAGNSSGGGSLSRDGNVVAFVSAANDLVSGDSNGGVVDCFVRDRISGVTTLVSVGEGGVQANADCIMPVLSADGGVVAFFSHATTLVPEDTNSSYDVFIRDLRSGVTSRVSVDSEGGQLPGGGYSLSGAMSADGNIIAFTTYASGTEKVFVRDRANGTTTRVSLEGCISNHPAISGNGNVVVYSSCAFPGPDGGLTLGWQLLAFDRTTGVTSLVTVDSSGNPSSSGAGPYQQVSFDGRYVAFDSGSSNLVAGDTNGFTDVFVRDRAAGVTTRISMGGAGDIQGDNSSCWPGISDDGRLVVFTSWATNLVPGDTNAAFDVFSFDRATGALSRLSVDSAGIQGDGGSSTSGHTISGDGRFVAFTSSASNLIPGDTNSQQDVFVTVIDWAATPVTVTAADTQIAVGDPLPGFTYTASGFVAPDAFVTDPVCTTTAADSSAAGTFPITCSGGVAPLGYTVAYTPGTLTVRPVTAVTVQVDNKSMTVGDPLPTLTYATTGFVSPETFTTEPTCSTTATITSLPGAYPITCSGGAAASWYPITYVNGTLTVNPFAVTVTADNQTMTTGGPLPSLAYTATGFVSPDTFATVPTCTTTATSASLPGDYPITCAGGVASERYVVSYVQGMLMVNPATVTVSADSKTITLGQPLPTWTYTATGFVGGETFMTQPVCTTTATSASWAGTYPITCAGAAVTGRYVVSYLQGTLTILPRPIAASGTGSYEIPWGGRVIQASVTINADLKEAKKTHTLTPSGSLKWSFKDPVGYPANYTLTSTSLTAITEMNCPGSYSRCVTIRGYGADSMGSVGVPFTAYVFDGGITNPPKGRSVKLPDAFGMYLPLLALPSSPATLTSGDVAVK